MNVDEGMNVNPEVKKCGIDYAEDMDAEELANDLDLEMEKERASGVQDIMSNDNESFEETLSKESPDLNPMRDTNSFTSQVSDKLDNSLENLNELKSGVEKVDSSVNDVNENVKDINNKLAQIVYAVNELNRNNSMHEKIEKDMQKELEQYKNDYYASTLKPVLTNMCELHVEFLKKKIELENNGIDKLDPFYKFVSDEFMFIEYLMRMNQVFMRYVDSGEDYDERLCQSRGVQETDDSSLNGKIAFVKNNAYIYKTTYLEIVLKPAVVQIYKYTKKEENE